MAEHRISVNEDNRIMRPMPGLFVY